MPVHHLMNINMCLGKNNDLDIHPQVMAILIKCSHVTPNRLSLQDSLGSTGVRQSNGLELHV